MRMASHSGKSMPRPMTVDVASPTSDPMESRDSRVVWRELGKDCKFMFMIIRIWSERAMLESTGSAGNL